MRISDWSSDVCSSDLLLDWQFITPHLESLGAIEMPQADYLARLYSVLSGSDGAGAGVAGAGAGAGAGAVVGGAADSSSLPAPPFAAGDWGALDALGAAEGKLGRAHV